MSLHAEPISLALSTPFRIAHGTSTSRDNVFVHVDEGVGVAAITPYYPAQVPDVLAYVARPDVAAALKVIAAVEELLDSAPFRTGPASAAIDMDLLDRWGKNLGQPLTPVGLNPERAPLSSYPFSMGDDAEFASACTTGRVPVLKIKLGSAAWSVTSPGADGPRGYPGSMWWTPTRPGPMMRRRLHPRLAR
jgi:L-alanine-DL-glutamate epimerase-like enolase superfamily enzyme